MDIYLLSFSDYMQNGKCGKNMYVRNKESIETDVRNVLKKLEEVGALSFSESFTSHEIDVLVEILTQ